MDDVKSHRNMCRETRADTRDKTDGRTDMKIIGALPDDSKVPEKKLNPSFLLRDLGNKSCSDIL